MLSIGSMGSGSARYHLELAREDYYQAGGEPPGRWVGEGARLLGLPEKVRKEHLRSVFEGKSPDGREQLAKGKHHPGWDLTFSAPKSVSILWALRPELRRPIQEAHFQAVRDAITYLEETAGVTKRGHAGVYREPTAGFVVATFEHGTSRAQDPQLHTHALLMNLAPRHDGTWGSIVGRPVFQEKMTAGALYRASLARTLNQELGLELRKGRFGFEVAGVPTKLISSFSKRRRDIEEELKALGSTDAKTAARAAILTRERKAHVAREELFEKWGREASGHSLTVARSDLVKTRASDQELRRAVNRGLERVERERSVFTFGDIARCVAEESPGQFDAPTIVDALRDRLPRDRTITPLGINKEGKYLYSTPKLLELAPILDEQLGKLSDRKLLSTTKVRERVVRGVELKLAKEGKVLRTEQGNALRRILQKRGGVRELEGLAAADKARVLEAARIAWTKRRAFLKKRKVIAITHTAAEASALQLATGIWSGTADEMLRNATRARGLSGARRTTKLMARPKLFELFRGHIWFRNIHGILKIQAKLAEKSWLKIDGRTVLIVDDADTMKTGPAAELIARVKRARGTVILAKDAAHEQPGRTRQIEQER